MSKQDFDISTEIFKYYPDYYNKISLDAPDPLEEERKITPINWDELKKIKLPEISWRIQNLIPISGLVILAAISGEKKTWVALEMARCIALGENFLGQSKFKTQAGNVLYIDMEMPKTEMIRRGKQLGLSEGENKLFILNHDDLSLYGYGDDVDENKKWFVNFIVENNISVVFIDTFRAVAGGLKEEKAEEIRKFFNFFKPLKHLGVTAVFLDHLRKPTRWEKVPKKEHLFSSQDKTANVEVLLMIQSEEGTEKINLYQRKNRLARETKAFSMLMKDEEENGTISTKFTFDEEIQDAESKKEQAKELIQSILESEGKTRKEIIEIVYEEAKIGERNTSDALKELTESGLILMSKKGRQNYYSLPESENEPKSLSETKQEQVLWNDL